MNYSICHLRRKTEDTCNVKDISTMREHCENSHKKPKQKNKNMRNAMQQFYKLYEDHLGAQYIYIFLYENDTLNVN